MKHTWLCLNCGVLSQTPLLRDPPACCNKPMYYMGLSDRLYRFFKTHH